MLPRGSILLTSILILGAVLLSATLTISNSLIENSAQQSSHENKTQAEALANACLEHAINALALDAAYAGNETVTLGTLSCAVLPIQVQGSTYTLSGRATVSNQTVTMAATLSARAPPTISSWQEIP